MTFRGLVIAGGVLSGAMGLLLALGVAALILDGELVQAIGISAVALNLLGCAAAAWKAGSQDIAPHVVSDGGGTTFWPDRRIDIPIQVGFAGVVLNMACQGFAIASGRYAWNLPTWVAFGVGQACVSMSLVMSILLWPSVRRGGSQRLRLSPFGVEWAGLVERRFAWEQVDCVTYGASGGFWPTARSIVLGKGPRERVVIGTGRFSPNGSAFGDLVEFYWKVPAARVELTDSRAAERLEFTLARR